MSPIDLSSKTLSSIQQLLRSGQLTFVQIVRHYLNRIQATRHLNAYIEIFEEEALEKARQLDQKIQQSPESLGHLFGAVISIKDVLCYKDHKVSGAAKILEGFTSLYSATAVERLVNEDAIIIGRVNCDQFGMGSSNENSIYGPVKNAADETCVSGGSSGGSAVAVQTGTCLASLGTDTGGSVRQPAAYCGVVGLKPTYGRISRHGLLAYASSFDQIGILAKQVEDAAMILEVMAGPDDFDSSASQQLFKRTTAPHSNYKIAALRPAIEHHSLDTEIKENTFNKIKDLENQGHSVEWIDFDLLEYLVPAYYILTAAEASSNLARYDGIHYGYRSPNATNLEETYMLSRSEGFSAEVKKRILMGTFVLSSGYYDACYGKAQKIRRLVQDAIFKIFKKYDFIILPTTPETAPKIGKGIKDPMKMYLADIFTVFASLAGVPAISVPLGVHSNGLPYGIQVISQSFEENKLLDFCDYMYRGL